MTQNITEKLRSEFSRHIATRKTGQFVPSPGTASEIGAFTRELEVKRQAGTITSEQIDAERALEELQENITRFNSTLHAPVPSPMDDEEQAPPVIIPQISDEEADKIITGFNKQFEEKVLGKLKNPPLEPAPHITVADVRPDDTSVVGSAPAQSGEEGVDLQNYLSTIKAERPNVPFADEDSGMDLSKLVARNNNV